MGTTVTTNLGLIKPDVNESIREDLPTFAGWAAQNEDNMDAVDALFRASTVNPYTVNWTAGTLNPTLGAGGFTEGKYVRLTPSLVIGWFRIQFGGAGFATGTGHYRINHPLAVDSDFATFQDIIPCGKAMFQDNSASLTSSAFTVSYNVAANALVCRASAGDIWSSTNPVVPAQNDKISGYFMYPTSVV